MMKRLYGFSRKIFEVCFMMDLLLGGILDGWERGYFAIEDIMTKTSCTVNLTLIQ